MPDPTCRRLGCDRPAMPRPVKRWYPCCSLACRYWQRAFTAFVSGGAAIGRDAATDLALFSAVLKVGLQESEGFHATRELYDAYGRT